MNQYHCWLVVVLMSAATVRAEPADPVAPYRELPTQIQKAAASAGEQAGWETAFEAQPSGQPFWGQPFKVVEKLPNPPPDKVIGEVSVKTEKLADSTVLTFDAVHCEAGFLPVGPKVKGNVALEIVCRSTGQRINDLSLILEGLDKGPGFQFGAYNNQRNLLRVDDPSGAWKKLVDLPTERLIVKDQWHTVRLEIVHGMLRAVVDGQPIGVVLCGPGYSIDREYQPLFYIYDSRAQVKQYRIQKLKADMSEQFAAQLREWTRQLESLIVLLDHQEFKVREEAQALLKALGPLAYPKLQAVLANGSLEQQLRAREILGLPEIAQ